MIHTLFFLWAKAIDLAFAFATLNRFLSSDSGIAGILSDGKVRRGFLTVFTSVASFELAAGLAALVELALAAGFSDADLAGFL